MSEETVDQSCLYDGSDQRFSIASQMKGQVGQRVYLESGRDGGYYVHEGMMAP